ncbi:hypothetical protein PIB30_053149 [Stylosanthes scabra]|uniref:F-box domain-containing protein n=1 Tax=Stylosanthes scabra TaxID=79078 RepID=A0ABU6RIC7_9FABA|nr:hypothetical protein [Stylosanthes scabra]
MATCTRINLKKRQQQLLKPIDNLSPELLQEIFLRVPVKSLFQLRCVSKQWRSLVSDSDFAKLHYDATITNNNNKKFMYLSSDCSKAYCVKIGATIHHDYAVRLRATYKHDKLRIIGSCRGFLLLQNDVPEPVLALWNPAMGSHRTVPYPDNFWNVGFHCPDHFCGGVVYEKFNDDYLVVLGSVKINEHEKLRPQWKFFSVRTNSWKEIEGGDRFVPSYPLHRQVGLLYNEAVHWLAIYTANGKSRSFVIVAFDPMTKTLSMIPLPYPRDTQVWKLSLLGGRGYFGIYMNNMIPEIWVMKEYKVESSWTKLNITLPCMNFIPLCLTESDEVVCRKDKKQLVKVGGKQGFGECGLISSDKDPIVVMFNESLFSLPVTNLKVFGGCLDVTWKREGKPGSSA